MDELVGCCICQAEHVSSAQSFVRGLNLGKRLAEAAPEQRAEFLRRSLCLRHCHELQEHEAWAKRNTGLEPPWPEDEPIVSEGS